MIGLALRSLQSAVRHFSWRPAGTHAEAESGRRTAQSPTSRSGTSARKGSGLDLGHVGQVAPPPRCRLVSSQDLTRYMPPAEDEFVGLLVDGRVGSSKVECMSSGQSTGEVAYAVGIFNPPTTIRPGALRMWVP